MTTPADFSRTALAALRSADRIRQRRCVDSWHSGQQIAVVGGAERLVFCSNDYLGLARDPRLAASFSAACERYGTGSGASHLVSGHSREHQALEEELAAFTGRQRALLFSTGYLANLGVISALVGRTDRIVADRLNHASLVDAAVLSRAELVRYAHSSVEGLSARLAVPWTGQTLLVTDGVFSMDGDVAPLEAMAPLAEQSDAWLMVDDAHGIGVLGATGRGTLEETGVRTDAVPILVGTLGKAIGTSGAFVAGDADLIELIAQTSRPHIYTTAATPAVAAATRTALGIVSTANEERRRLRQHIELFRREVRGIGLTLLASTTAIQPIVFGSSARAVAASEFLWERGIWVSAIRPPTVPEGSARLRVTLAANHTQAQVLRLLDALRQLSRSLPDEPA